MWLCVALATAAAPERALEFAVSPGEERASRAGATRTPSGPAGWIMQALGVMQTEAGWSYVKTVCNSPVGCWPVRVEIPASNDDMKGAETGLSQVQTQSGDLDGTTSNVFRRERELPGAETGLPECQRKGGDTRDCWKARAKTFERKTSEMRSEWSAIAGCGANSVPEATRCCAPSTCCRTSQSSS